MDVARTSMIHAAAPHFLWPFAVQYAAHQINLQPRVSLPKTTPTLRWTRKVRDASAFRVWESRAFVRDTSADKLSSRAVPCVFLGFPPDAPGWQFYHPTLCRVLSSHDVTFDESVSYYRLFPYRASSLPLPPLFLVPGTPPVDPLPPQGPAPSGVSQVDPAEPVEVAVDSGAARGAEHAGAGTGGAEPERVESWGAEPAGAEPGGAEPERVELGGAEDVLEDRQEEFECFAAAVPHLVSMLFAPEGDPDAPDIPTPRSYAEAIEGPYFSQWQAAMDAEMASWKSTGTYIDDVPPPGANIVTGMWIFMVKRPPGSPPVFKARYVARGFTFLQGSLHEEIWLRRTPGFTGSFPAGTQWSLWQPVYGLRQAPREWHDTLRTTLAALGFAPFTADPSLFLRTDTTLTPFYVLVYVDDLVFATADTEAREVLQRFGFTYASPQSTPLPTGHSLSAPPSDESVEPSGPYPELVGCLILGSGSVSWRSTRSSSVLSSSCEAEIHAGAMAAQELRWLTYLLTDLGEAPRSPPFLYVDNKAMLALCQEHRLEHRTKHIALRYFLARELQQRGQLRLAYVASQANTADVFTKALQPCDHQRFCTVLGFVPTVPHLLTS
ncbi:unnamed protein product [Closterium sp. NIES-54]